MTAPSRTCSGGLRWMSTPKRKRGVVGTAAASCTLRGDEAALAAPLLLPLPPAPPWLKLAMRCISSAAMLAVGSCPLP